MDFKLNEEQQLMRDMFREYAQKELKAIAAKLDEEEHFPIELIPQMAVCWVSRFPMISAGSVWALLKTRWQLKNFPKSVPAPAPQFVCILLSAVILLLLSVRMSKRKPTYRCWLPVRSWVPLL